MRATLANFNSVALCYLQFDPCPMPARLLNCWRSAWLPTALRSRLASRREMHG
jgi:hypothetical protein